MQPRRSLRTQRGGGGGGAHSPRPRLAAAGTAAASACGAVAAWLCKLRQARARGRGGGTPIDGPAAAAPPLPAVVAFIAHRRRCRATSCAPPPCAVITSSSPGRLVGRVAVPVTTATLLFCPRGFAVVHVAEGPCQRPLVWALAGVQARMGVDVSARVHGGGGRRRRARLLAPSLLTLTPRAAAAAAAARCCFPPKLPSRSCRGAPPPRWLARAHNLCQGGCGAGLHRADQQPHQSLRRPAPLVGLLLGVAQRPALGVDVAPPLAPVATGAQALARCRVPDT